MPQPPDNLASQLRASVLASDHETATRLTVEYTQALSEYWMSLSAEERAASPIPKQSLELLDWARKVTIMHHAMADQHLAAIQKANRYLTARANYLRTAAI